MHRKDIFDFATIDVDSIHAVCYKPIPMAYGAPSGQRKEPVSPIINQKPTLSLDSADRKR
jgi:hypothetical protein